MVTTSDIKPSEICRREVVVTPDLVHDDLDEGDTGSSMVGLTIG